MHSDPCAHRIRTDEEEVYPGAMTKVAALIIGDEILSGKVRDTNAPALIDALRDLGVGLRRIAYVSDEIEEIAAEVRWCAERFDAVITSGGVGPTHDDRTVAAVALAFGVPVVRDPELVALIEGAWGERCTSSALRMADVPRGARLLHAPDRLLPIVVVRNVYLLPGVPQLFVAKLAALQAELEGEPTFLRHLFLNSDESRLAPLLAQVADEFPLAKIGSYPRWDSEEARLWITVEGASASTVDAAVDRLVELLPAAEIVRLER